MPSVPADAVGRNKRRCDTHLFSCKELGNYTREKSEGGQQGVKNDHNVGCNICVCITFLFWLINVGERDKSKRQGWREAIKGWWAMQRWPQSPTCKTQQCCQRRHPEQMKSIYLTTGFYECNSQTSMFSDLWLVFLSKLKSRINPQNTFCTSGSLVQMSEMIRSSHVSLKYKICKYPFRN